MFLSNLQNKNVGNKISVMETSVGISTYALQNLSITEQILGELYKVTCCQ